MALHEREREVHGRDGRQARDGGCLTVLRWGPCGLCGLRLASNRPGLLKMYLFSFEEDGVWVKL